MQESKFIVKVPLKDGEVKYLGMDGLVTDPLMAKFFPEDSMAEHAAVQSDLVEEFFQVEKIVGKKVANLRCGSHTTWNC